MSKLHLLAMVCAIAAPIAARAEPAPSEPREIKIDCEHDASCVAAKFADALSAQPSERDALRLGSLVTFQPGSARVYSRDREKLMALAASWQEHVRWTMITVEGYADASRNAGLAQQRADKIRGYLIRYGVDAEYIIAIEHDRARDADKRVTGRIDLTIELCHRTAAECRAPGILGAPADDAASE
jgi:outer membrane protein OmpA-like peptidoglycan-associated protein